jgi:hypothetical protein
MEVRRLDPRGRSRGPRPRTFRAHHFIEARLVCWGYAGVDAFAARTSGRSLRASAARCWGSVRRAMALTLGFAAAGAFLDQVAGPFWPCYRLPGGYLSGGDLAGLPCGRGCPARYAT